MHTRATRSSTLHALAGLLALALTGIAAADAPLRFYLDADRSLAKASGDSIEAGIRAALADFGGTVHGRPVELVLSNHRGNSKRALRAIETFQDDPDALAMFCGMHSPPILAHRDYINANQILLMNPWAAAGPITRPPATDENWIFRLSVDDTNAGTFIAREAVARGVRKPVLFLEETGWGRSNYRSMTKAFETALGEMPQVEWFDWGVPEAELSILVRHAIEGGGDAVVFVGNAPEGADFISVMAALPQSERLPVFSHWGITGGTLKVDQDTLDRVDLLFIQTDCAVAESKPGERCWTAFERARDAGLLGDITTPSQLAAPTGFVHAYDLTSILLQAIADTELTGDIAADRAAVRATLTALRTPVEGLIRTYEQPFRPYTVEGSDAHEALGINDYTLARFAAGGAVVHVPVLAEESLATAPAGIED